MAVKTYKPTTSARRNGSVDDRSDLSRTAAAKSLCRRIDKTGGRNHHGRTTSRFRGGGARRIYRIIDFKRDKDDIPARIASIEYDPNRNCYISILNYKDGEKRYILSPEGVKVGDTVISGQRCEPRVGNAMQLGSIPSGMEVHNIEINPGQGGKLARGAGNSARLVAKEGNWVTIVLPSGEMRMLNSKCRATVGQLSNPDYQNIRIGKAGRNRHKGRRPHVRAKAQNPVSHPMGGGEGRSNGGRHPCSPTGKLAKGGKTRNPRKNSSKWIIRRRRNKRQGVVSL